MTTEFQGPYGPPWDVDVVADVHAGVYPPEQTAQLRRLISEDPQGAAVLSALDSTVDDLSLLPALTMPPQYAARLDAALAAEYASSTSVAPAPASAAAAPVGTAPAVPAAVGAPNGGPGNGGTDVIRGHLGALLQPGTIGPTGPNARPSGGQGPTQLPQQAGSGRPAYPPRRQPVIPAVLPGGPRPVARSADTEATTPSNVTELHAATERPADSRPPRDATSAATAPGRPTGPSGPTGPSRVGSLEAQRAKRRRWTGGLLAAAAVVAIGAVTAVSLTNNSDSNVAGAPEPTQTTVTIQTGNAAAPGADNAGPQALELEPGKLGDSLDKIEGKTTTGGPLANPVTQAACLGANKVDSQDVTGITQVTYEGKPAYAITVKQDNNTKVDVLVVGENCGTDGKADLLDSQVVSR